MTALIDVILPVFLVIGFGYAAARFGIFNDASVDGVMRFAQTFAVPCLLFRSIATLDLSLAYDAGLMLSFYIGAFAGFAAGFLGARLIFGRAVEDAVAIGFVCLFSNSLLLGLPITERAYGTDALAGNYAILSIHAPVFYAFGITVMELARSRGKGMAASALVVKVSRAILTQPLVVGIVLGFAVNLSGLPVPPVVGSAVEMMARAALPVALFGLGGVLHRFPPQGDMRAIAFAAAVSLILHPLITWSLGRFVFDIGTANLRSAVLTAAMAPGVNAYLFANMYGVAKRVAASTVLLGTAASILSIWGWLNILP